MPYGDGTGPLGLGPMTGRGAGFCAGFPVPGYMNPFRGFGWGFGRGWRRRFWISGLAGLIGRMWGLPVRYGWWHPWHPGWPAADEKAMLKEEINALEKELDVLRKRLHEIEQSSERQ